MSESFSFGEPSAASITPKIRKPPIRPVGFTSLTGMAVVLYLLIFAQVLTFGFSVWYFNELRKFDWLSKINRGDQVMFGIAGGMFDVVPSGDELDEFRFSEFESDDRRLAMDAAARERLFGLQLLLIPVSVMLAIVGFMELTAFLLWQGHVQVNLRALGSEGMRYGLASGIVWWFVPLAVLWMPVKVLQEAWRASDPSVAVGEGRTWRLKPDSGLAMTWWLCLLVFKVLFWFVAFMLSFGLTNQFLSPLAMLVVAFAGMAVTDVLEAEFVRQLTLRQHQLFGKRMIAADKAAAAGEPVREATDLLHTEAAPAAAVIAPTIVAPPSLEGPALIDLPPLDEGSPAVGSATIVDDRPFTGAATIELPPLDAGPTVLNDTPAAEGESPPSSSD